MNYIQMVTRAICGRKPAGAASVKSESLRGRPAAEPAGGRTCQADGPASRASTAATRHDSDRAGRGQAACHSDCARAAGPGHGSPLQ